MIPHLPCARSRTKTRVREPKFKVLPIVAWLLLKCYVLGGVVFGWLQPSLSPGQKVC